MPRVEQASLPVTTIDDMHFFCSAGHNLIYRINFTYKIVATTIFLT